MHPRSFWLALAVGVVSSVAAAVCLTAAYYETRAIPHGEAQAAQEVADGAVEALWTPERTGLVQVDPDIMVLAVPETRTAQRWWIAGAFFAALAVTALALAVARRRKVPKAGGRADAAETVDRLHDIAPSTESAAVCRSPCTAVLAAAPWLSRGTGREAERRRLRLRCDRHR